MGYRKRVSSRPFLALTALSFAAIVGLGFFRFSASQLEYRLSHIERSIERYSAEEVELQQVLSGLVSPIKIYSYCKDRLGMNTAQQEIVYLPSAGMGDLEASEPQKGWSTSLFSFFGLTKN